MQSRRAEMRGKGHGLIFIRNETIDFNGGRQIYFSPFENFIRRAHQRDLPMRFVLPATERGVRLADPAVAARTSLIGNARGFFTGLSRIPEMLRAARRLRETDGYETVVVRLPEHVSMLLLPLLKVAGFRLVIWLVHDRRRVQEAEKTHRKGIRAPLARLVSGLNGKVEDHFLHRVPVISNGTALVRQYCRGNPRTNVVYSTLLDQNDITDLGEIGSQYRYDPGRLNIIYAGRLSVEKGMDRLFDFFEVLQNRGAERGVACHLTLVGKLDDTMRDYLQLRRAALADPTSISVVGFVKRGPDLWATYRNIDFFCLLSKAEGSPRVVPEAYATGMPVIISTEANTDNIVDEPDLVLTPHALMVGVDRVLTLHADAKRYLRLRARLLKRAPAYSLDRLLDIFLEQADVKEDRENLQ